MIMDEIKKKIEKYVEQLLYVHDMSIYRNINNRNTKDRIVTKCMEDLQKNEGLLELLENDSQIKYFVRQTILYMI